jgi:hypothetical protein
MINPLALKQLSAPQRAQLIYTEARSELSNRLWRAALGSGDGSGSDPVPSDEKRMGLDALLALFSERERAAPAEATMSPAVAFVDRGARIPEAPLQDAPQLGSEVGINVAGLGANARHRPALESAAARTGIPANALAAIVHAEAAKGRDGSWQCFSRNPRSSAAGLGQFLSGTWEGMAETKGSWLNGVAQSKGWLDSRGRVVSAARSALLSLRYDPTASINAIADYAQQNLNGLKRAGVSIGSDAQDVARSAYLGHHLGLGDAIKFLKGGLDPARARLLLGAQIGSARASQHIADAGNATVAHRSWFLDYVNRNIRPERFSV